MTSTNVRQIIADSQFFAGLDDDAVDFLADHAVERKLAAGKVLFQQGERAAQFYLLVEGQVSLGIPALEGPALELQAIGPGQIAGWSWLLPPHLWSFQARAGTDIRCLEFDGEAILARCEQDPRFGYELIKRFSGLMSERLHFAREKMMQAWRPAGFA
jgi:CRP/FNR family cyclic AMP-dependent transcriptional regulator